MVADDKIEGFNPFVASLEEEVRRRQVELVDRTAHAPSRRARLRFKLRLWRDNRLLDIALWALPAGLFTAAAAVFALSWPVPAPNGNDAHVEVVIGCASVVFLGAILAEAISLPLGQAAELGPGLTQSLIRRPSIWLAGLSAVPLSIFLFWLGTQRPDEEAALGSALLAGGAFSLYWAMTRLVLSSADPIEVANSERRRLLRNVDRFVRLGADLADAYVDPKLPDEVRTAARAARQRQLAAGPIRQLRSGARRLFAKGATDEGLMLTDAMIDGLLRVADRLDGAIGDYNSLPGEVLESIEGFVSTAMMHHDDFVAVQLVERLNRLALLRYGHGDVAALRLQARGRLRAVLDATWDDMSSRVPSACAGSLGQMPNTLTLLGAHEDAGNAMHELERVILRAAVAGRAHIGGPAMSGFIDNLALVMQILDKNVRGFHLHRWSMLVKELFRLAALPDMNFTRPQDQLIPGVGLAGGTNLQQVVVVGLSKADGELISEVLHAILGPLQDSIRVLAAVDQAATLGPIGRAFDLALCLNHLAVSRIDQLSTDERSSLAAHQVKLVTAWLQSMEVTQVARELGDENLAAHLWSNLVSAAFVAGNVSVVQTIAGRLIEVLQQRSGQYRLDPYGRVFLSGMALLAGRSAQEADTLAGEDDDPFSFASAIHPILGRAPACLRPAVFIGDPASTVDEWLVRVAPDTSGTA